MNSHLKKLWSALFVYTVCLSAIGAGHAAESGWAQLPDILQHIKTPTFPDRDFDITQFGAKADGKTDCTDAIKTAITRCHEAGGGRVLVPGNGTYYTGPIHLKSHVHLEVAKGATLLFSDNFMDYLPPVLVRWEGEECYSLSPLIYADHCENIAVTGEGTLIGNGATWWRWRRSQGQPYRRANDTKQGWAQGNTPVAERILDKPDFHWCPTFISPYHSRNILIEGLTLIDGPFWNVHPVYCENVTVRNMTIRNHGPNGDGCNPDSCRYVLIQGCLFDTGDDCIAIKSGKNTDGRRVNRPSEYIIVQHCTMRDGHGGVVMGSEMTGDVRNVYAEDCDMDSPNLDRALRIKTNSVRGGTVENVYMRNVRVGQVADAVFRVNFLYGEKDTGEFTPAVRNINMENVTCGKSRYGLRIDAYERSPVSGIYLKNCSFANVKEGNILNHVKDLTFDRVTVNGRRVDNSRDPRPNLLLIMADDMGYSDIGCFGGEIHTPNLDQLAANGMRFTQFYNCAKCNPTRATLLTGQYNQAVGTANMQFGATFAEVLRPAGYRTLIAGKWHQNPLPTTRGFDRYFGLADGGCKYVNPGIEARPGEGKPGRKLKNRARRWAIEGQAIMGYTNPSKDFYTTDAFTDYAIDRLEEYKDDGKPFLLYLPYTAPHYPLNAWPEDIAKYRGKYRMGWDKLRQTRYRRMADMGIIDPKIAPLSKRDGAVPAWDTLTDAQKDAQGLKMAVYAAMVDRLDQNIGRVITKLKELGKFDNTLILFLSDNGGCAENVNTTPNIPPGPVESYRTVGAPWANASNTPYRKFKSTDFEGGNCTPFIAHWPNVIKPGQITDQTCHIIDIMPTFVELAHASYPDELDGRSIKPLAGKSLVPILNGEKRAPHRTLYWQYGGASAVRIGEFKLVRLGRRSAWELYDLSKDRTETNNLADQFPNRVTRMEQAWDTWWQQNEGVK